MQQSVDRLAAPPEQVPQGCWRDYPSCVWVHRGRSTLGQIEHCVPTAGGLTNSYEQIRLHVRDGLYRTTRGLLDFLWTDRMLPVLRPAFWPPIHTIQSEPQVACRLIAHLHIDDSCGPTVPSLRNSQAA